MNLGPSDMLLCNVRRCNVHAVTCVMSAASVTSSIRSSVLIECPGQLHTGQELCRRWLSLVNAVLCVVHPSQQDALLTDCIIVARGYGTSTANSGCLNPGT